jgi:hypothetical protein
MSKTKGQTFQYRFGNETKTFLYRSQISLIENRLFRFVQNLLSWTKWKGSLSTRQIGKELNLFLFHFY